MASSPVPAHRRRGFFRIFASRQSGGHAAPRSRHARDHEPGQPEAPSDAALAAMHAVEAALRGNRYFLVTYLKDLASKDLLAVGRAGYMVSTFAAALARSRCEVDGRWDDAGPVPPGFGQCLSCLLRQCGICRDPMCFHRHSWARPSPVPGPAAAGPAGNAEQVPVLAGTHPQESLPDDREPCE